METNNNNCNTICISPSFLSLSLPESMLHWLHRFNFFCAAIYKPILNFVYWFDKTPASRYFDCCLLRFFCGYSSICFMDNLNITRSPESRYNRESLAWIGHFIILILWVWIGPLRIAFEFVLHSLTSNNWGSFHLVAVASSNIQCFACNCLIIQNIILVAEMKIMNNDLFGGNITWGRIEREGERESWPVQEECTLDIA